MSTCEIWDSQELPIQTDRRASKSLTGTTICLWNSSKRTDDGMFSINEYIEENDTFIKRKFVEWAENLGRFKVFNDHFRDLITIEDEFSYWWMSEFVELSNFSKSLNFVNVIKLIAFDDWVSKRGCTSIILYSKDRNLFQGIKKIADEYGIALEHRGMNYQYHLNHISISRFFLPDFLRSILWLLKYLALKSAFKGLGQKAFINSKAKKTFVSYFSNFDDSLLKSNNLFLSNYWGALPKALYDRGIDSNWLHIHVGNEPNIKSLRNIINDLNNNNENYQNHVFLESFISIKLIFNAFRTWLRIRRTSKEAYPIILQKYPYFGTVTTEFKQTFTSYRALNNIINFYLMKRLLNELGPQDELVYLHENLPWDKPLNYFSTLFDHKLTIGFLHTSIRFWDLRYSYLESLHDQNQHLCPSIYAVNGKLQFHQILNEGFNNHKIEQVESLRYEHLMELSAQKLLTRDKDKLAILIVGCYINLNTEKLLEIVNTTKELINQEIQVTYKPHPALGDNKVNPPNWLIKSDASIQELLLGSDVIITSSVTTTPLEAYLMNKKVIVYVEPGQLNMSPLRNIDNSVFIYDSDDFLQEINSERDTSSIIHTEELNNIFNLDKSYPRWLDLLRIK